MQRVEADPDWLVVRLAAAHSAHVLAPELLVETLVGLVAADRPPPSCESGLVHIVLEYTLVDDYLERRAALRDEHLALARAAHERGELLLAGRCPTPTTEPC